MFNVNEFLRKKYKITQFAEELVLDAEKNLTEIYAGFDKISEYNSFKVIEAFKYCGIQSRFFSGSTGYGYSDEGRDKLGELYAHIFDCEKAIVSPLIASGTHAITIALFGLLRPFDTMLCITGKPYDTLSNVIGLTEKKISGSLKDFAINYQQVDLLPTGEIDINTVIEKIRLDKSIKIVYLQRSRGYDLRPALSVASIENAIKTIKQNNFPVKIIVDNCYGEFTEISEPTNVGADIIIGSLIKNPGSGLAPTGGYIAGKGECIDLIASRLTTPSTGIEIGSYAYGYLPYYQGIYLAPQSVNNALKGAALTAYVFEKLGYTVNPRYCDKRSDITQAILFGNQDKLIDYIRSVQEASPIDANVIPYPWEMPGYDDKVIMAAGTFIQGGSIELSADAPIRPPYIAYMQGGIVYENVKLSLLLAASKIV